MKTLTLDPDSIFSLENKTISGHIKEGVINSRDFIRTQQKVLMAHKDQPDFEFHLYEYSAIIKELVKQEMIDDIMRKVESSGNWI